MPSCNFFFVMSSRVKHFFVNSLLFFDFVLSNEVVKKKKYKVNTRNPATINHNELCELM